MLWVAAAWSAELVLAAQVCDAGAVKQALGGGTSPDGQAHVRPHNRGLFKPRRRWTTAMHGATTCALDGKAATLDLLLPSGAQVDLATQDRAPALHLAMLDASEGGRRGAEVAARLLQAGAQPSARYRGRSAAHALYDDEDPPNAIELEVGQLLVDAGVSPAELLCAAASEGDVPAAAAWLESGLSPDGSCMDGSPLVAAAASGQGPMVATLLAGGAAVDQPAILGGAWVRAITLSAADGWAEGVAVLIEGGAVVDGFAAPSWAPATPPLAAALLVDDPQARQATVSLLVEAGADRAVWADERTVFRPGSELPSLAGDRALDRHEAAVKSIQEAQEQADHPLAAAIRGWGPTAAAALVAATPDGEVEELLATPFDTCGALPTPSELRKTLGRPDRTDGHWAQRWHWGNREALVDRTRRPGRWATLRVTGDPVQPCQTLVGHTRAAAHLMLGPPTTSSALGDLWNLHGQPVMVRSTDGVISGWELLR